MHLTDGAIHNIHAITYSVISGAVVSAGIWKYKKASMDRPEFKILCGGLSAFLFIVTVFEIPMPFGSSEHPTGTPLISIFVGPLITALLSLCVLILELLFQEGGIKTLGANVFSLGVVGGLLGWGVFKLLRTLVPGKAKLFVAGFFAGLIGDLSVYAITAFQLSSGGTEQKAFLFYLYSFLPAQLPLAFFEGIFTASILVYLSKVRPQLLIRSGILRKSNLKSRP